MMNLPYQITARLPIGAGEGVVELRAYTSIFGPSELKQTLAAHAARELASELLAAADLVDAHAATDDPEQENS